MQIIHAPHPSLRKTAHPITNFNKKVIKQLFQLAQTLETHTDPPGVGLAAPQVDLGLRAFALLLPTIKLGANKTQLFINPEIIDHSDNQILGETPNSKEPRLEGCLSIPLFYGAVPRWEWIQIKYLSISSQNPTPVEKTKHFKNFAARVVQHENDHLDGVLFIDRTLDAGLPLYRENPQTEELEEIKTKDLPRF